MINANRRGAGGNEVRNRYTPAIGRKFGEFNFALRIPIYDFGIRNRADLWALPPLPVVHAEHIDHCGGYTDIRLPLNRQR
jgi:hypothetical protein